MRNIKFELTGTYNVFNALITVNYCIFIQARKLPLDRLLKFDRFKKLI